MHGRLPYRRYFHDRVNLFAYAVNRNPVIMDLRLAYVGKGQHDAR